jgi:hypothetical protein
MFTNPVSLAANLSVGIGLIGLLMAPLSMLCGPLCQPFAGPLSVTLGAIVLFLPESREYQSDSNNAKAVLGIILGVLTIGWIIYWCLEVGPAIGQCY